MRNEAANRCAERARQRAGMRRRTLSMDGLVVWAAVAALLAAGCQPPAFGSSDAPSEAALSTALAPATSEVDSVEAAARATIEAALSGAAPTPTPRLTEPNPAGGPPPPPASTPAPTEPPPVATPTPDLAATATRQEELIATAVAATEAARAAVAAAATAEAAHLATAVAATLAAQPTPTPTFTPTPDLDATATAQAHIIETYVAATMTAQPTPTHTPSHTPTFTPTHTPTFSPTPTKTPNLDATADARARAQATRVALTLTAAAPAPDSSPTVRIAYVYGDVGDSDVYVATIRDGRVAQRRALATQSCDEAEPGWSPAGETIAYHSNCAGSYDLYLADAAGEWTYQVTTDSGADEREPDVSPDGEWIAYRSNPHDPNDRQDRNRNHDGELRVVRADGSGDFSLGIQGKGPAWSPSGRQLAFMSERSGSWEVYVYDFDTSRTLQLTDCIEDCRWPHWSPDGGTIILNTAVGEARTPEAIQTVPAGGGRRTTILADGNPGRPQWSPRDVLIFNSGDGIEMSGLDGRNRVLLIPGKENWGAAVEQ